VTTPTRVAGSDDAPSTTPRRGRFRPIHLAYVAGGLLVAAVLAFNVFQPIRVLPRIRLAPGFSFRNQDGQRRTSEDYRGKVTLFTATCTRRGIDGDEATARMQAVRDRL
jgi:protein SCO1